MSNMINNISNYFSQQTSFEKLSTKALAEVSKFDCVKSDKKAAEAAAALFASVGTADADTLNNKVDALTPATEQVILRAAIKLAKDAKKNDTAALLTAKLQDLELQILENVSSSSAKVSRLPSAKTVAKIAAVVAVFAAVSGVAIAFALSKVSEAANQAQCSADSESECPATDAPETEVPATPETEVPATPVTEVPAAPVETLVAPVETLVAPAVETPATEVSVVDATVVNDLAVNTTVAGQQ